ISTALNRFIGTTLDNVPSFLPEPGNMATTIAAQVEDYESDNQTSRLGLNQPHEHQEQPSQDEASQLDQEEETPGFEETPKAKPFPRQFPINTNNELENMLAPAY